MPDAIDAQGEFTAAFVEAAEGYLGNANPHLRRDGKWSQANNIANISPAAVNGAFGVAFCGPQASTQGALALVVDPTDIRARRHIRTGFKSRKTVTPADRGQSGVEIGTGAGASHRTQNIADAQIGAGPVANAVSASHDRAGAPLRAAGDAGKTIGPKITPEAGQPDTSLTYVKIAAARISPSAALASSHAGGRSCTPAKPAGLATYANRRRDTPGAADRDAA